MRISLTRSLPRLALTLCLATPATAGECPDNPDALGTSRTIVVDPRAHGRIGAMDYAESLPLVDKEVVLTFDDGPLPPYSSRVLDILKAECVRATYFIVGRMARAYPHLVRRVHEEGHTIGTHSMSHPLPFRGQGLERSKKQIEDGIAATAAALGDAGTVAPFFRFPGLGRTDAVEHYLGERGLMAWSADFPADDWRRIGASEIARRALHRLEKLGKGVLLLHDIKPATALALPTILAELKRRGYRIVHVLPATADRPATPTTADAWLLRPRPRWTLPTLSIASIRELAGDSLAKASPGDLCDLKPLRPPPPIRSAAKRRSKAKRTAAHVPMPDRHAVQ